MVALTFNQIIEVIKDIAVRHPNINSSYLGKNWELENQSIDVIYPVLQFYPESARMPENDNNEYKIIELDLRFRLIDRVFQGEGNEKDTLSDMLTVAKDVINEINRHPYYKNSYIKLINNINFTPIEEQGTDFTAGQEFLLTLKILNYNTFCGLPFDGIPGFSVPGVDFTGGTYNTQFLTCSTVTGCTSFQDYITNAIDAGDTNDITRIQSGLNTYTGGTGNNPTINISAATLTYLSASTISGGTFYSGSTPLQTILSDFVPYSGATNNVNLNSKTLTTSNVNYNDSNLYLTTNISKITSTDNVNNRTFESGVNGDLRVSNLNIYDNKTNISCRSEQYAYESFLGQSWLAQSGLTESQLIHTQNLFALTYQSFSQIPFRVDRDNINGSGIIKTQPTFDYITNSNQLNGLVGVNSTGELFNSGIITNNGGLSATTISGGTFYSGSTPLQSIITNIVTASTLTGSYLDLSGGTVTGITTFTQGLSANSFSATSGSIKSSGLIIRNPANTFSNIIVSSAIVANRNFTLPLITSNDTFVTAAFAQTLTSKTLTSPVINTQITGNIVNGTINTTNRLVGETATQTLSNKTAVTLSAGTLSATSIFVQGLTANTINTSAVTHSTNILNQIGTTSTNYGTRTDASGFKIAKTSNLTTANSFPFYLEGSASGRYMRYNANTFDVITAAETALNVLVQGSSVNPAIYAHKADNGNNGPVMRVSRGVGSASNSFNYASIAFGLPDVLSVFTSVEDSALIKAYWNKNATTTTSTQFSELSFETKNAGVLVTPLKLSANTATLTGVLYTPVSSQSNTTSAYTINCATSNIIEFTATTACTLSYSGASEGQYKFIINNYSAYTVTFATGATWYSNLGVQPNITGLVYIDAVYSKGRMFINELESMQQI